MMIQNLDLPPVSLQFFERQILEDRFSNIGSEIDRRDLRGSARELPDGVAPCSDDYGIHSAISRGMWIVASVLDCTSRAETPGASSCRRIPSGVTSSTQMSVITRWTTRAPVRGNEQAFKIFGCPDFVMCSMRTTTRWTPATKSIAPPMPFISLPGTIQFARSLNSETCIAPRIARSICPPRIMAKDSALEK